ncbi:hypothetical protein KUTeg_008543 [Tegillarca granosa]|uniref:Peroxidase n=1 Tax=Tegillarca granosa TaxID=220873 RepID=A0ABQ9FC36_TEGGR|nr:hypothetical protein KUTeg_008543 [Tegillarca granosa]
MLMAWGQFLAHDMVLTPESSEPRQQINQITAFIDASNVYGSSEEETDALRNKTTDGTLTGDERVNTVPNLIMMHLMFAREHNRIVKILDEYHSRWGEKKKFQEARKIVGALMQHITYSEYLPKILSQAYMDSNGLGNTANDPYDTSVNPGIINGYGSAAGRSPIDVDFYVGGISEIHVPGASVGPTFACVINKQFESLKKGDRFWYERNDSMDSVVGLSSDQIAAIKGVTLATVMCNNLGITKVQPDVFQVISESNALQDCSNYNFDLTPWE